MDIKFGAAHTDLTKRIKKRYGVKIKYKEDYKLWKLWPFKGSMAIGNTIWLYNRETPFPTLAHESGHIQDQKEMGLFDFLLTYFQPQWWAIIPLVLMIAGFSFNVLWAGLVGLVATILLVLPWPSKQRLLLELNAELIGLATIYWITGEISENIKKNVIDSLCSWAYYKMIWWNKEEIKAGVEEIAYQIINEHKLLMENQAYSDAYKAFYGTKQL